ncbi:hypothetical protein B7P43_G16933 [Cryptotermes secundus]|uniref:HAT C-terminal dimerisation domain-containing protein n=1 Tax=Cryptotermes secundus TaxID=105785 RepID=A0A2J7PKG7_9NEOP|nr:hypothetical protein B7P43_G16933 [Cryptotermes secundus]
MPFLGLLIRLGPREGIARQWISKQVFAATDTLCIIDGTVGNDVCYEIDIIMSFHIQYCNMLWNGDPLPTQQQRGNSCHSKTASKAQLLLFCNLYRALVLLVFVAEKFAAIVDKIADAVTVCRCVAVPSVIYGKAAVPKLRKSIEFFYHLAKNDLSHFPRLNSIAPVMKDKLRSYEGSLRRLRGEFERRFQDFSAIEKDLDVFSMPFNVDCETVKPDLQLELIELQCNTQLKQLFLNVPKLEFYKSLSKSSFPNLISHAQKVTAMFASSYICEQVFSTMKLRKSCIRNRLTDEHLTSLLRISASQFEPDYEKILEMQSRFHSSHSPS